MIAVTNLLTTWGATARHEGRVRAYGQAQRRGCKSSLDRVTRGEAVEAVGVVWRTLMRVRRAVGDYDGVVSTFAQCQRALRAAEIAPAAATRALLDQLRP